MRTFKLTITYDGTRYAGWQVQQRTNQQEASHHQRELTIQGVLERLLQRIMQEPVRVVGSGRTDAGVHAEGQVAHIRVRSAISVERLRRALNSLLPTDIAVTQIEEVPATFHARFNAVSKRYQYRIFLGPVVPPFIRSYVHHVRIPLNLALMRREAQVLRGRHNFQAFARRRAGARSAIRMVTDIELKRCGDELRLEIEGNGFLHTMVRSITGTLIDIGRGHLPAGTIRCLLQSGMRHLAGTTAPACGLTLMSVEYRSAHK